MMVARGTVFGGKVVLDDASERLPDGARVEVRVVDPETPEVRSTSRGVLGPLAKFVGAAPDLALDAARNHDHYLYGTEKR